MIRKVWLLRMAMVGMAALLGLALPRLGQAFDQWGDNGSTPVGGGSGGGPPGDPGGGGCGNGNCESEPVDTWTGQYLHDSTDIAIPGRLPLRVRRYYRSGSAYQGMFGRGWNMEFNERLLVLSTNGNLLIRRDNSDRHEYALQTNGTYVSTTGRRESLTRQPDGTYTLADKFGNVRTYDNNGCLTEVRDRNGNQLLLTYHPGGRLPISAISEYSHVPTPIVVARDYRLARIELAHSNAPSGRFLEFRYDGFGRVTNVSDFSGRAWRYGYDPAGHGTLVEVTTPGVPEAPSGYTSRYSYEATNRFRLATVTDRRGTTFLTNRYDSSGRVIRQFWGPATYHFAYPNATLRYVTNGNGFVIERLFNTNGSLLTLKYYTKGVRPGDPAFWQTRFTYEGTNGLNKTIFAAGNVETKRFDNRGNIIETRLKTSDVADAPEDLVTISAYEPRYNFLKTATDALGNVTSYVYDYELNPGGTGSGNLAMIVYPAVGGQSSSATYAYNNHGDNVAVTNLNGSVTLFTIDPNTGFVLQRIEAAGTALAATNRFTYDARGNQLTWNDARGNSLEFFYDTLDRVVENRAASVGAVTRFVYTPTGKLAREERETGIPGSPVQTRTYTYDTLDRLETLVDDLGNTTRYGYDANGNQNRIIDAATNTTQLVFDERDLLYRATDAQSNIVTFGYSPNGRLARRVDGRTNTTLFVQDRYDRLTAVTNADGSTQLIAYDRAGYPVARRTRAGRWTTNTIDNLGRVTEKRFPDGAMVQFTYDAVGRPLRVTDTNGASSYVYDLLGRLVRSTNTTGRSLQYDYDPAGNLTRLTYPDGTFVNYAYDGANRVTNVNYGGAKPIASFSYDRIHRRTAIQFGNGLRTAYGYDAGSRLAEIRHEPSGGGAALARFAYAVEPGGNRLSVTTEGTRFPGVSSFDYDRTYQLTRGQYPAGNPFPTTTYNYDAAGNRSRVTAGSIVSYTANRMNQYTLVGAQPLGYAANGGLTNDGTWSYVFDDEDRLTTATRPGTTARYAYDAMNRRVTKDVNGSLREFIYHESSDVSTILAEANAGAAVDTKYIYYGLTPLAMVTGGSVYYLHCDQLERPVLATDDAAAVAWEGAFSAFGEPSLAAANSVPLPLRSPGLYADTETGLNYNLTRYYDTKLGRFITADPAMEAGSPLFAQVQDKNAYAYVRNNPVNSIDPNGQSVFFIVCSAGLPVCSAALFCSLNAGACSGGIICSANIGVCSAAVACSGNVGAACSGSIAACSASASAACSGNAGGLCSGAVACSAQLGSGIGACSGSILACSAQAGVYGASACSGNLAGACSGQASVIGGSACSAQVAGVCSGQAGIGGSACSAQWGGGACSLQVGAGVSGCSGQAGGACSAQYGPGGSYCSAMGGGACSSQWGPGPGSCSGQGLTCSASSNCPKNSDAWEDAAPGDPQLACADVAPQTVSGLRIRRDGRGLSVNFAAQGSTRFTALTAAAGSTNWVPVASGPVARQGITRLASPELARAASEVLLRLENRRGDTIEIGPVRLAAAPAEVTPPQQAASRPAIVAWLSLLAAIGFIAWPGKVS